MKKRYKLAASLSLFGLLTGCSPFGPVSVNQTKTYAISQLTLTPTPQAQTHQSITVMPITASRGFDSTAMIYELQPYLFAPFVENAWIAPPATMMTILLTGALQQSAAFSAVVMGPSLSNTHYLLNVNLLALFQDFTVDPSEIVIHLDAALINSETNNIIADKTFSARVPTKDNTPYGGVLAANAAVNTLLNQISQFVIAEVTQDTTHS